KGPRSGRPSCSTGTTPILLPACCLADPPISGQDERMKVLATGTEGYIGSLLPRLLVQHGHEVVGVDTGYYAERKLYETEHTRMRVVQTDIRQLTRDAFEGIDAVVHMAELANDPVGQLAPKITANGTHERSVQV